MILFFIELAQTPQRKLSAVSKSKDLPLWLLCLQDIVPAFAIDGPLDEGRGLRRVGGAQVLVIPLDLLPRPVSDISEVIRFRRPTRVLKVRAGHRTSPLGIVDPLRPVAGRARQRL